MKILYTVDNIWHDHNAYVRVFVKQISAIRKNIFLDYGIRKFWSEEAFQFDIIHIMWPHFLLLLGSRTECHSTDELEVRFSQLEAKGVIIVSTCHNIVPHYNKNQNAIQSYNIVYRHSRMIFHLGRYSLNAFEKEYVEAKNVLLEHPVYDIEYPQTPSQDESLSKLGLSHKRTYLLCFGAFRNKEERQLIMEASKKFKDKSIRILAPKFFKIKRRRNVMKMIPDIIIFLYYKLHCRKILFSGKNVPCSLLPYYFRACDIAVIQRTKILNSGNLPLNFYFGNIVVGPNIGNIATILKESGNPVFDPENPQSLTQAISEAISLLKTDLHKRNRQLAINRWNSKTIAQKQLAYYDKIKAESEKT